MAEYFIRRSKKVAGPLTLEKVREYIATRKVKSTDVMSIDQKQAFSPVAWFFPESFEPVDSEICHAANLDKLEAIGLLRKRVLDLLGSDERFQWEQDGAYRLHIPLRVVSCSSDGKFVFFEGSRTGVPIQEVMKTSEIEKSHRQASPEVSRSGKRSHGQTVEVEKQAESVPEESWDPKLTDESIVEIEESVGVDYDRTFHIKTQLKNLPLLGFNCHSCGKNEIVATKCPSCGAHEGWQELRNGFFDTIGRGEFFKCLECKEAFSDLLCEHCGTKNSVHSLVAVKKAAYDGRLIPMDDGCLIGSILGVGLIVTPVILIGVLFIFFVLVFLFIVIADDLGFLP